MKRPNYLNQIRGNIEKAENGSVFVSTDFTDLTEKKTVNIHWKDVDTRGEQPKIVVSGYNVQ